MELVQHAIGGEMCHEFDIPTWDGSDPRHAWREIDWCFFDKGYAYSPMPDFPDNWEEYVIEPYEEALELMDKCAEELESYV
jgi:hypothetical protein